MSQDSSESMRALLDKLREQVPADSAKATLYLAALDDELKRQDEKVAELQQSIAEFQEAYAKLTAPANRLGVFVRWLDDGTAQVALGDSEFVTEVDPAIDPAELIPGARIRLNDAYAVVGLSPDGSTGALVKVAEALEDGRLRIGGEGVDGDGRLVLRSAALTSANVGAGDRVRLDPTGRLAIELVAQAENRDYFFEDVPEIGWDQVGGQEEAIAVIKETIEHPLLHPEIYKKFDQRPIKGLLLYGPPGCGKTLLGKAAAHNLTKEYAKRVGHEVKEYFMYISGPKILNMWLGETERMVREIFQIARQRAQEGRLVFIFMDEAESVLRTRSSGRYLNISNTVVPQFCAELDGMVSLDNVVLMLTSNRPDYIDPAVLRPERIDRKLKVKRPDRDASRTIFGIYLHAGIPLDPTLMTKHKCDAEAARNDLLDQAVDAIWQTTPQSEFVRVLLRNGSSDTLYWKDLVSGALLKSIVDRAKRLAIGRAIGDAAGEHGVSIDDITQSIQAEFAENEIFPKADTQDDWLKLLDVEPENVASVRPVSQQWVGDRFRRPVI